MKSRKEGRAWQRRHLQAWPITWTTILRSLLSPDRRFQWPRGLRLRSAADRLLRLWVRNPPGALMSVCCECCVLSGRGLCDELIIRPEESYRLWRVVVCDLETSWLRRPWPTGGCGAKNKGTNKQTNKLNPEQYYLLKASNYCWNINFWTSVTMFEFGIRQSKKKNTCLTLKIKALDRSKRQEPLPQQHTGTPRQNCCGSLVSCIVQTKLRRQPLKALSFTRAVKNSAVLCA